jgi:hypothetical protein
MFWAFRPTSANSILDLQINTFTLKVLKLMPRGALKFQIAFWGLTPTSHFLWNEKEGRKQKERVDYIMGGSCTCAFSWFLGTPSGSWPPVPFPNVNALIWEPPLQLKSSGGLSNTSRELGSDSWSRLSKILQCPTPSVWPHAGTENHSRSWRWPTSHQCRPQVGQGEPAPMLVPWPFWVSTLSGHIKPKKC